MSFAHSAARAPETTLRIDVKKTAAHERPSGKGRKERSSYAAQNKKKTEGKTNGMSKKGEKERKARNGRVNDHARKKEEK